MNGFGGTQQHQGFAIISIWNVIYMEIPRSVFIYLCVEIDLCNIVTNAIRQTKEQRTQ